MPYDINNNPVTHISFSTIPEGVSYFVLLFDCETEKELHCDEVVDLTVEAKHNLESEWIDLETDSIDLSEWNGTRQAFEFRITAEAVENVTRRRFNIRTD